MARPPDSEPGAGMSEAVGRRIFMGDARQFLNVYEDNDLSRVKLPRFSSLRRRRVEPANQSRNDPKSDDESAEFVSILKPFSDVQELFLFGFCFLDLAECVFINYLLRTNCIEQTIVTDKTLRKLESNCPWLRDLEVLK